MAWDPLRGRMSVAPEAVLHGVGPRGSAASIELCCESHCSTRHVRVLSGDNRNMITIIYSLGTGYNEFALVLTYYTNLRNLNVFFFFKNG